METSTPQDHKMNDTFHRFPYLPWDIREQIWKFTLRPPIPGVHFFRLYNPSTDAYKDEDMDLMSCHQRRWGNPSTCLIDEGLWTACKESRHVVQHSFGFPVLRSLLWDKGTIRFRRKATRKLGLPATGYFAGKDTHFFTVFPNRDLLILRPQDTSLIRPGDLSWYTRFGARWQGFQGFQHIALEYNIEDWQELLFDFPSPRHEAGIRAIITLGYYTVGDKLWFIDYTLSRRHEAVDERSPSRENATFYLDERRFIEVDCSPNSLENWKYTYRVDGEDVEKAASHEDCNSVKLVRKAQGILMDTFGDLEASGYGLPRQVGLLAYESF